MIRTLNLDASGEEIEAEIHAIAGRINRPAEETIQYYEQENRKALLKEEIKERKLFDLLLTENKFTVGEKQNYTDMLGIASVPQE